MTDRLAALEREATPGPWTRVEETSNDERHEFLPMAMIVYADTPDAAFIAAARNLMPELLAVVRAAEADHLDRHGGSVSDADACVAPFCKRLRDALAALREVPHAGS